MLIATGNPLPAIIHATLTPEQLGTGRVIIVGDVHGCLAELRELLGECDFTPGTDALIFVGDLVNKGPSSAEVGGFHVGSVPRCLDHARSALDSFKQRCPALNNEYQQSSRAGKLTVSCCTGGEGGSALGRVLRAWQSR